MRWRVEKNHYAVGGSYWMVLRIRRLNGAQNLWEQIQVNFFPTWEWALAYAVNQARLVYVVESDS